MKVSTMSLKSKEVLLPDGKYTGTFSGYVVRVTLKKSELNPELSVGNSHKITVEFETVQGIRGSAEVAVVVKNGYAFVTTETHNADAVAESFFKLEELCRVENE